MKKVLVLFAVCAFAVSPLGFVGCGETIEEDPDAKANEAKQNEFSGETDSKGGPDDLRTLGGEDPAGKFGPPEPEKKD